MIKPAPPPVRGIAGLLLLFCLVGALIGLGADLLMTDTARFSVIAEPGGRAVLGVGVAAGIVLIAHAMRLLLGRRDEGKSDAGDHA